MPTLSRFACARMKKRKHQQALDPNNGTSTSSNKRNGNAFVGGVGNGTSTSSSTPTPTAASPLPAAPSPNRVARFQSERASLPIWLARKQLLAEVKLRGVDGAFIYHLFSFSFSRTKPNSHLSFFLSSLSISPIQLRAHDTVILVGETGSGKSTQLPQLMLDAGLAGGSGSGNGNEKNNSSKRHNSHPSHPPRIAVTQPRRVAASTVARRVASERGSALGGEVGYAVRFVDATSPSTRIKFLTDGMLLREALLDPLLSRYGAVLLDEAHERTVQTDVLFGLVKEAQEKRRRRRHGRGEGKVKGKEGEGEEVCGAAAAAAAGPLKVVVMSATLDAAAAARYFGSSSSSKNDDDSPAAAAASPSSSNAAAPARVVLVPGRAHPVEIRYLPAPEPSYVDAALRAVLQIHAEEAPGDILVFLTGQDEIEALARLLVDRSRGESSSSNNNNNNSSNSSSSKRQQQQNPTTKTMISSLSSNSNPSSTAPLLSPRNERLFVVPLYAALSADAQAAAFAAPPPQTRKVVLATNVAETSVTVPGVRFVVDSGLVKLRSFDAARGADLLAVVPVSKAQAKQRAGRAGREAPGKCFRLYTEESYCGLAATTLPEIARVNLRGAVLQLAALGVRDPLRFDFMDRPPAAALLRAVESLVALGAFEIPRGVGGAGNGDQQRIKLTEVGAAMARLPVDPPLARVLLAAAVADNNNNDSESESQDNSKTSSSSSPITLDAAAVVAMVSTDQVFLDSPSRRERTAELRARFAARGDGDAVTALRVFRGFQATPPEARKGWCSDFYFSYRALRKAVDIYGQLLDHLVGLGLVRGRGGIAAKKRKEGETKGETADDSHLDAPEPPADTAPLRRALASGLFAHAALRSPDGSYHVIATGAKVAIHPSSVLCGVGSGGGERSSSNQQQQQQQRRRGPPPPACIVFDELLRTARDYARGVTVVDASWLPEIAPAFFARHRASAASGGEVGHVVVGRR